MTRNPVLLVHGIDDTVALFHRMKPYLERGGLPVHALNLVPNNGNAGLIELARQLDAHVRTSFAADQGIDIVGFSMGGLVSRYYIQRLGGIHRVRKFVTIGTPHGARGPHSSAPTRECATCVLEAAFCGT